MTDTAETEVENEAVADEDEAMRNLAVTFDESGKPFDSAFETSVEEIEAGSEHAGPDSGADEVEKSEVEELAEGQAPKAEEKTTDREAKDAERFDRNWKKFQDEKDAFRREKEAFAAKRNEQPKPDDSNKEYTAADYEDVARQFEEDGRDDLAQKAREKAGQLTEQTQKNESSDRTAAEWDTNLRQAVTENPDLNDAKSELYLATEMILAQRPQFRGYAEGISDAVEHAKAMIGAKAATSLREQLAERDKQISELNRKLTPASGEPDSNQGQKSFDEMSEKEQEKHLLSMAAEFDATNTSGFRP